MGRRAGSVRLPEVRRGKRGGRQGDAPDSQQSGLRASAQHKRASLKRSRCSGKRRRLAMGLFDGDGRWQASTPATVEGTRFAASCKQRQREKGAQQHCASRNSCGAGCLHMVPVALSRTMDGWRVHGGSLCVGCGSGCGALSWVPIGISCPPFIRLLHKGHVLQTSGVGSTPANPCCTICYGAIDFLVASSYFSVASEPVTLSPPGTPDGISGPRPHKRLHHAPTDPTFTTWQSLSALPLLLLGQQLRVCKARFLPLPVIVRHFPVPPACRVARIPLQCVVPALCRIHLEE